MSHDRDRQGRILQECCMGDITYTLDASHSLCLVVNGDVMATALTASLILCPVVDGAVMATALTASLILCTLYRLSHHSK